METIVRAENKLGRDLAIGRGRAFHLTNALHRIDPGLGDRQDLGLLAIAAHLSVENRVAHLIANLALASAVGFGCEVLPFQIRHIDFDHF